MSTKETKKNEEKVLSPLETLLAERRKTAIEVIAPKIIELVSTIGIRNQFGFVLKQDGVEFLYNELLGTVVVSLGPQEMFAVNVESERCTLFRKGSWIRTFDDLYQQRLVGKDIAGLRQRHEVKFRENFGLPIS